MNQWLEYLGNLFSTRMEIKWLFTLLLASSGAAALKLALNVFAKRWRHLQFTKSAIGVWHDIVASCVENLKKLVIFIWIFSLMAPPLHPNEWAIKVIHILVVLATSYQFFIWGMNGLKLARDHVLANRINGNGASQSAIGLIYVGAQTLFISLIVLLGLSNLGIDVGALLAGLGVGGIAVALAAQNILGDLLASLSIVFDKPFIIGDFINVGNDRGTVEHIGIKTTRVRSLSGEELIFSNKDLLESRIQNYKRMSERRVVQTIGVVYSTPPDALEKIPLWIKEIIDHSDQLRFDRCHFAKFGNFSLDFEIVFWVLNQDYNIYMDLQQNLLMGIYRKFQREKIEFAFPTQTLFVEKLPLAPKGVGGN